jgi:flagellar biosynthesis chaperone FliJ
MRQEWIHMPQQLSSLDANLATSQYKILKLHAHVQDCLMTLRARGEDTQDLLANLFKAYSVVPDRLSVEYL